MRKILLAALLTVTMSLPALASWVVKPDGAAIIENDGSSSISLRCDNNANTNFKPGWLVRVDALNLRSMGARAQMVFRFAGQRPITLMGDNRNGFVSIDSMNLPNQSDLTTLVHHMKAASRVTVTLIDDANGTAMEPLAFNLRGSSRAIGAISQSCH